MTVIKILVVEDEQELCNSIAEGLELDGYITECCYDGETAFEKIMVEQYDLVILDLNLPFMDGIDIIKSIRKLGNDTKILILSARDSVASRVKGLDIGANDYLVKPFAFSELEARIRNLLRRNFSQQNVIIKENNLSFDSNKRELSINGIPLSLTKKELAIFEYLILNKPKVISQEELLSHAWDSNADSFSSVVRVHIATLRKKLKNSLGYDPIKTKIGEGYYLKIKET